MNDYNAIIDKYVLERIEFGYDKKEYVILHYTNGVSLRLYSSMIIKLHDRYNRLPDISIRDELLYFKVIRHINDNINRVSNLLD